MPMVSEITPLLIITKLEQYDYAGATAISVVLLVASFALLLLINGLQGQNVLSIVVEIDKARLGGPMLAVTAQTV